MGYETTLIIGKSCLPQKEWKLSNERYDDDSGWKPERDEDGNILYTDRTQHYFMEYARIDLCKCGHGAMGKLHNAVIQYARARPQDVHYFYKGDDRITKDLYDDPMTPWPLKEVLEALREAQAEEPYRRFAWAIALLEAMASDCEEIQVLFYGH